MQGTVKTYDTESRTGSLLTDGGAEVGIDAISMQGSELRLLRIGQRLDFALVEEDGRALARSLKIPSF